MVERRGRAEGSPLQPAQPAKSLKSLRTKTHHRSIFMQLEPPFSRSFARTGPSHAIRGPSVRHPSSRLQPWPAKHESMPTDEMHRCQHGAQDRGRQVPRQAQCAQGWLARQNREPGLAPGRPHRARSAHQPVVERPQPAKRRRTRARQDRGQSLVGAGPRPPYRDGPPLVPRAQGAAQGPAAADERGRRAGPQAALQCRGKDLAHAGPSLGRQPGRVPGRAGEERRGVPLAARSLDRRCACCWTAIRHGPTATCSAWCGSWASTPSRRSTTPS